MFNTSKNHSHTYPDAKGVDLMITVIKGTAKIDLVLFIIPGQSPENKLMRTLALGTGMHINSLTFTDCETLLTIPTNGEISIKAGD